jgi:2-polyprenyl-3-methyl-5-hydroxy-6-metoxy-1,4-benzoquinol methylase
MSAAGARPPLRYDSRDAMDPPPGTSWALVLAQVPAGARVLDVGCSTGAFAVALKRTGCHVTGIEIDPAAAEIARTRADVVHCGDVATLLAAGTLPAGAFDVIVAADVLEHLVDPWAVTRAFRALLRPGGIIVASLPNVTHAAVVLELARGRFPLRSEGLLDETHLRFFGEASALDLFRAAGYHAAIVGRTRLDPRNTEFATRLDDVPDAVVEFLDRNPNADTYQFIIRAAVDGGGGAAPPPPPPGG